MSVVAAAFLLQVPSTPVMGEHGLSRIAVLLGLAIAVLGFAIASLVKSEHRHIAIFAAALGGAMLGFLATDWWWLRLIVGVALVGAIGVVTLYWLGATAVVAGLVIGGVLAILLVEIPWLYEPDHFRTAIIVVVLLMIGTLVAIAHEFSRTALRLAAVATAVTVVALTMKLGRFEALQDLAVQARADATTLDVELAQLHQHSDATAAGTRSAEVQQRIDRFCSVADGETIEVSRPFTPAPDHPAPDSTRATMLERCMGADDTTDADARAIGVPRRYRELREQAAWALAELRDDLGEVEPAARAKIEHDAVLAFGGADEHGTPVNLLTGGGAALVGGVPGLGDDSVPAAIDVVIWVALAGVVILGYRWLEILRGKTEVGPVSVREAAPGNGDHVDEKRLNRLGQLRGYIIRNIPEPGAVPGAESLQPVTDLAEAAGDPTGKILAALLKLVGVLFPKTGYTVEALFSDIPTAKPTGATALDVTVIIKDARTGRGQHTINVLNPSDSSALREAGYRVAAWVISQGSRTPAWARWDEGTAAAMCEYSDAKDLSPESTAKLEKAVRTAPASGLLLGMLGHSYDLERRHAEALSMYLRAVALFPRYPVARYRSAISFSLLAARNAKSWIDAEHLRDELDDAFKAAVSEIGMDTSRSCHLLDGLKTCPQNSTAVTPLALTGDMLLRSNAAALTKHNLVHQAFRRSERGYWLPLLLKFRSRATDTGIRRDVLHAVNESARPALLVRARAGLKKMPHDGTCTQQYIEEAIGQVDKAMTYQARGLSWQVDYNLGCAKAIEGDVAEAFNLLRGLVRRPNLAQLTRVWVDNDPDLDRLRSARERPRLETIVRHLQSTPPTTTTWT